MTFEWDPIKNKANLEKHGIAFEEAMLIFEGPVLTRVDNRIAYGEVREISVGEILASQLLSWFTPTETEFGD